jgi:uncharacterized YkwD family protein
MFQKLSIVTASTFALTFGGIFSTPADSVPTDIQQIPNKVIETLNEEWGSITEADVSDSVKVALEKLATKWNLDLQGTLFAEKLAENPDELKEAEQEAKQEQKEQEPVREKEEAAEKPQKEEQVTQTPAPEKEQPAAQPAPEKEQEQTQSQEEQQVQERPNTNEQPRQQEQNQEQNQQNSALSQFEQQVVELTNQERANNGLQPLQIDEPLSNVARDKSRDMAGNGYFDHNSPSYGSPFDMMNSYGISYNTAGENIAKGQRSPQEVVQAWMDSPGHRANILNGNFTHIGVGHVEHGNHWTQMFIGK